MTILLLILYSPCTFNNANPKERPSNVIPKHVAAAVTISAFAYGKIAETILKIKFINLKNFYF